MAFSWNIPSNKKHPHPYKSSFPKISNPPDKKSLIAGMKMRPPLLGSKVRGDVIFSQAGDDCPVFLCPVIPTPTVICYWELRSKPFLFKLRKFSDKFHHFLCLLQFGSNRISSNRKFLEFYLGE